MTEECKKIINVVLEIENEEEELYGEEAEH